MFRHTLASTSHTSLIIFALLSLSLPGLLMTPGTASSRTTDFKHSEPHTINVLAPNTLPASTTYLRDAQSQGAAQIGAALNLGCVNPPLTTTIFYDNTTTFNYRGGALILSSTTNGVGQLSTDDEVQIDVTRPDGSTASFNYVFGYPRNSQFVEMLSPRDVSNLFQAGTNTVRIRYLDNSSCASSQAYYLVEPSPSESCADVSRGLVSWWKGDGDAKDSAGSNNGTTQNGVAFGVGKVGQSFGFDGGNAYVEVPDSQSLDAITSGASVEGWINPVIPENERAFIFARRDPNVYEGLSLAIYKDGKIAVILSTTNSSSHGSTLATSPGIISFGQWQHIAATVDTISGRANVYVNGIERPLNSIEGPDSFSGNLMNVGHLFIGQRQKLDDIRGIEGATGAARFKGSIDELSVYSRAITTSEVQSIFIAGSAGKCDIQPPQSKKWPLIFIPGITGSRLDVDETDSHFNLWPGPYNYSLLSLEARPRRNIIATDVFRVSNVTFIGDVYGTLLNRLKGSGYLEYDDGDDPAKRRPDGCQKDQRSESGEKPNLFVFPYDWRLSNAENTAELDKYVQCVQLIYPGSKVDILTHSMGGLLARNYIIRKDSPPVDKLVTVSAPWLGATDALHMMESGKTLWGVEVPILKGVFSKLAQSFPSVHELLPSSSYFALGGRPLLVNGGAVGYHDYKKVVDDAYPGNPAADGALFHDGYPGQDDGRSNLKGVKYHHLYSIQNGRRTVTALDVQNGTVFCAFGKCVRYTYVVPRMGAGDGTVPELSLSRDNGQSNLNASAPIMFRNDDKNKAGHTGLLKNEAVLGAILSALQGTPNSSSPTSISSAAAEAAAAPMYYLRYHGPTDLTITDGGGQTVRLLSDPPEPDLPTVTSYPLGSNSAIAVIPPDQNYLVTFRSDGQPMSLEVTKEEEAPLQAVRYVDVGIPAGASARLRLTPQGVEELRYDQDGDGTYETVVPASAAVTGAAAQDAAPPAVTITGMPEGTTARVTITATDSGSGVKGIFYSLGGNSYQPYVGSFTVDSVAGPVVHAYADDQAANRSAVATFYPSLTANSIDNARFFVRQHYLDFLNREPDADGLAFWTGDITKCDADAQCVEVKRINVSAAFFLSIEFQETGYLAYRAHKVAFGNIPNLPVPITREQMLQGMEVVARGLVVGPDGWQQKLEQNKAAYFEQFVTSGRFAALYPQSMTPTQFVDALNANADGALSSGERSGLIVDITSNTKTRAQVLRTVAEDADLNAAEKNKAFVLMQYFGYLRRNPNEAPDSDFGGWNFWLGKLNEFNGNYIKAEMVKAFLSADEYRKRFGQ